MAMDLALSWGFGLYIDNFAKDWGISEKTVRRDLDVFRELGQRIEMRLNKAASADGIVLHYWVYARDAPPLFIASDKYRDERRLQDPRFLAWVKYADEMKKKPKGGLFD